MAGVDPISAGVGAAGSIIGDIVGMITSAGDKEQARRLMERAAAQFDIPLPDLERMVAEQLGPSAQEGVYADPALAGEQDSARAELGRISDSGGMTLEDRANFEQGQRQAAQRAQAQRQAIVNLVNRTSGGNAAQGASVAAQLGAVRDQAENAANAGMQTAGDARKRATQAILERGRLASSQRGQVFDEASRRAAARDAVTKYNTDARMGAQRYNLGLNQQQFNNQAGLAGQRANTMTGQAAFHQNQADRTQSQWADRGTGYGMAAGALIPGQKAQPATSYEGYSSAPSKFDEDEY